VGKQGARVNAIVEELHGEKVDIIKYSEDMNAYIAAALAPATVLSVTMVEEKSYLAVVPDDQLSLAIGKEGQNVRLAARLTGCKIDIKTVTGAAESEALAASQQAEEPAVEEDALIAEETPAESEETLIAEEAPAAAEESLISDEE
jgi:N utilization substance protein A